MLPLCEISAITEFVFVSHAPMKADIIFLPGGANTAVAEKTAELYHAGFARLLLPSGLHSKVDPTTKGSYASEWEAMVAILLSRDVPEACILREDQATYTLQNALFSRAVLDRAGITIKRALLVTRPVHARRARLYYQSCFPEAALLSCPAEDPGVTRENWFLSSEGVQRVFGEITRIGQYQGDLLLRD